MHVDTTSDCTLANFVKRILNNILREKHIIYKIPQKKKKKLIIKKTKLFQRKFNTLHITIPYNNSTFYFQRRTFWKFSAKTKTRFTKFLKNEISKKRKKDRLFTHSFTQFRIPARERSWTLWDGANKFPNLFPLPEPLSLAFSKESWITPDALPTLRCRMINAW